MNIFRFPYTIDVSGISSELEANKWAWNFDSTRQQIYEQRNTQTIAIRGGKRKMGIKLEDSQETYDSALKSYFPSISNFINYFIEQYQGECGRIAIAKLPSSKKVTSHIDEGAYYRLRDRFHLVIDGMYLYNVDGESDVFSPGNLFWFDSQKTHFTENIGEKDRIAIIFDVKNCKFREKLNV